MEHDPGSVELPVRRGDLLLGKYSIGETLGVGGMGVVVAAEHVQLGQRVAVKFLAAELRANADAVERFSREARAAARIRSEHVVRVVDVHGVAGDLCYMVMEFLEGQDLSQLVAAKGRLSVADSVGYVLQACEAIGEAHGLGIVHRDLKPSNLFLTHRRDGSPLIKVLDFGISKASFADGSGHPSGSGGRARRPELTSSRMTLGSPMYMSPEQLRSSKAVDARADVWGLGVILHELLTGEPAFNGESTVEVLAKIVADPPTPPRTLRPELPVGLEQVVLDCLEKNPASCIPSVVALAKRLEGFAPSWAAVSVGRVVAAASQASVEAQPPALAFEKGPAARVGGTKVLLAAPSPEGASTTAHLSGEVTVGPVATPTSRGRGSPRASSSRVDETRRRLSRKGLVVGVSLSVLTAGVVAVLKLRGPTEPPSVRRALLPSPREASGGSEHPPPSEPPPDELSQNPAQPIPVETSTPPVQQNTVVEAEGAQRRRKKKLPSEKHVLNTEPNALKSPPAVVPPVTHTPRDCDPNFYLDSQGEKHFKAECF